MSKIIVAGAGHGGVVAAMLLAKEGHDVTVYEKSSEGECGLDQRDSLDATALDYAEIEIPEHFNAPSNQITFVPLDKEVSPVTIPVNENYRNLTVERKEFINYLISLAKEAGAKFVYNTEIESPVMLGSRIAGIKTNLGEITGDLIIDACGLHSTLRENLPEFTHIERETGPYDTLHAYRAYFKKIPGVPDPENKYNLYILEDGTEGFRWAITEENFVDVLLIRFPELTYSDVAEGLRIVNEFNPQMDKEMIRGGKFTEIPVRQPLSVMVADGYAAIGDAAFMTYAVKGSGMAYSIKAAKMLADTVIEDSEGLYNAETLWNYEKRFFKEIGFSACNIAIAKNLLPFMTAKEVNDMFKMGLISTDELEALIRGEMPKAKIPAYIRDKIKILGDVPEFRGHMMNLLGWVGKFATTVEPGFPEKYSRENVIKWAEKYNKFFYSIKRKDEEQLTEIKED